MILEIVIDPAVADFLNRESYTRAFLIIPSDDAITAERRFAVRALPVFSNRENRDSFIAASIDYVGEMAREIKLLQDQCNMYSDIINRQIHRKDALINKDSLGDIQNGDGSRDSSNVSTVSDVISRIITSSDRGPKK